MEISVPVIVHQASTSKPQAGSFQENVHRLSCVGLTRETIVPKSWSTSEMDRRFSILKLPQEPHVFAKRKESNSGNEDVNSFDDIDYITADENLEDMKVQSKKKRKILRHIKHKRQLEVQQVTEDARTNANFQLDISTHTETSQIKDEDISNMIQTLEPLDVILLDDEMMFEIDDSFSVNDGEDDKFYMKYPWYMPKMGIPITGDCVICLENTLVFSRSCCDSLICDNCLNAYCENVVNEGGIQFTCPQVDCDQALYLDEVFLRLSDLNYKKKLYRSVINANSDPTKKTCPNCCEVYELVDNQKTMATRSGVRVVCSHCQQAWCFLCHAPWHFNITCKQFRKGDKPLKNWAKQRKLGQVNARRCPKCKVFIQRMAGCDHMTCSKCGENFCYQCGSKFRSFRFLGNHYSKFSIFGCKYRLWEDRPVLRKFVRGSIFAGQLLVAPVVGVLIVAAGAVAIAGAIVGSPVLLGLYLRKLQRRRRKERIIREDMQRHQQRLDSIHSWGDPYLDNYAHLQRLGVLKPWELHNSSREPTYVAKHVTVDID